ncbi:MAG: 50S ribosomal protein L24 [Planctomycetota bacterium]|nr:50S ribosomal protein L24 [Planctomycetota bacterium]
MKIRKNDTVVVLSGEDAGKRGKVIRVFRDDDKVLVQGVNYVWKHMRRSADYPHGARIEKELPLPVSRVMLVCTSCDKPTRIAMKSAADGSRVRTCKKCKQPIGTGE